MKKCIRCKALKDLNEFHKCNQCKDKRVNKCKDCLHELYLRTYTPKKIRTTSCKVCGVPASKEVVLTGKYCKPCKAEAVKKQSQRNYAKKKAETFDEGLFTYTECITWIELTKARGAWVTLTGLNDLITVYNSLGGKHSFLELMQPGEQLFNMWLYCKKALQNEKSDFKS